MNGQTRSLLRVTPIPAGRNTPASRTMHARACSVARDIIIAAAGRARGSLATRSAGGAR